MYLMHAPALLLELFAAIQLFRFWKTLHASGHFDDVVRRFYNAFLIDCAVALLFMAQLYFSLQEWTGFSLASQLPAVGVTRAVAILIFACFFFIVQMYCRGRLDHDSAARTVAALKGMKPASNRIEV